MNRFYSLPDDVIDHVFRIEHSLKFSESLSAIKLPFRRKLDYDTHIWSVFLSTNMTKQDIREWYLLERWLDIDNRCHPRWLTSDLLEEMERSIYVGLYKDFLRRLREM